MVRLNSYEKTIAKMESHPPKIEYVATLRSLKPESDKYFEAPYEADKDPAKTNSLFPKISSGFKKVGQKEPVENKKKFIRKDPVTVRYTINYLCDFESEDERMEKVYEAIKTKVSHMYKNVGLIFGVDYEADIRKRIL